VVQAPYEFSDADSGVRGPAPHRGEHNAEVLQQWLSLPLEQIESFEKADVLLCDGRG
jgi:crotonobetainyl-CoA:carnitine CoA-transferase CaiB-like acyl-CoA transferase